MNNVIQPLGTIGACLGRGNWPMGVNAREQAARQMRSTSYMLFPTFQGGKIKQKYCSCSIFWFPPCRLFFHFVCHFSILCMRITLKALRRAGSTKHKYIFYLQFFKVFLLHFNTFINMQKPFIKAVLGCLL